MSKKLQENERQIGSDGKFFLWKINDFYTTKF